MASIIRVKRSTGTIAPGSLNFGELALTTGTGTQANKGDRLFVGYNGDIQEVGGKYYTDLLDHVHGTLTASSAVIVDASSKIDQWNVDNLRLDGNTITSTDTDGNITITPDGTGRVRFLDNKELQFGTSDDIRLSYDTAKDAIFFERGSAGNTADIRIADDIHFQFGTDNDARIYYDEASTDKLQIEGADWNFANGVAIVISDVTQSTDKDSGALVVEGGVGIEKNLNVGGDFNLTGSAVLSSNLSVAGVSTFTGEIDSNGGLNVSGGSTLDTLNVTGVSTFVGIATFSDSVYISNQLFVSEISVGGATFGVDITTRNLSASGIGTFTGLIDGNGGAELKNVTIGVTDANKIDTSTGNLTIDSAGGTVTIDDNLSVTGFATVVGAVHGNNFISTSTSLLAPTAGNYIGERLRLYDFNNNTKTNYAIGVEGSNIWFGVDDNIDGVGFKWYGNTTQVMRLGGTGNLTIAGDLRINGNDIQSSTGDTVITLSGNDAEFADGVTVAGISTFTGLVDANGGAEINNVRIGIAGNNEIDTSTGFLTLDSAGGTTIIDDHVDIYGDLDVSGNISLGGTTILLRGTDVFIENKDFVLGYTTSITPNDTTANHAGVAIASTEGSPLSNFEVSGINTLPSTYKQLMWFKSGTLGFATDAFAFNYGVAVGTTVMADGVRLAVGSGVTISDDSVSADKIYTNSITLGQSIDVGGQTNLNNLYVSGVSTFAGSARVRNIRIGVANANEIDTSTGNLTIDSNGGTTTIDDQLIVSGISTFNSSVIFDSTGSIQIPVGDTSQRPGVAVTGQIRYNSEYATFEGFGPGGNWGSLGGVKDVDGNTYIIPESSPGANENILYFYNDGYNSATLDKTGLNLNVNLSVSGISTFTGLIDGNDGAELKNVRVGVTNANEIDTSTGNLTIDSAGGTVNVTDQFVVTGISTFNNDVDIDGSLNVDTNVLVTGISTFTGLVDANGGAELKNVRIGVTNANEIDTSTGNLTIDSAGGTVTVTDQFVVTGISTFNSDVDVDSNLNVDGDLTVNGNTVLGDTSGDTINTIGRFVSNLVPSTNDTRDLGTPSLQWRNLYVNGLADLDDVIVSSAATISTLSVTNNISIGGDQTLTGNLIVQGNTTLGNSSTDAVVITGVVTHIGPLTNIGGATIDSIGISSNTISTKSGSGNTLYIDPYPDGLSNEGTVVIKGDLQVDGTTTTVNSVTVTSNNPIYVLGDNVTNRTVVSPAGIGTNLLSIDSVAGLYQNDVVTGTNIPVNTIINDIDNINKIITISNSILGSIDAATQITISQGVDTNDDRGIAFKYVSSGIGTEVEIKTGFFGYDDSTSRWTYVPDATITNNVISGTKGYLDIKGIFYQSGDFSANGISYFNGSGQLTSTVAPGSGISTSNYILTTDASGVPTWTDTIDGGLF